MILFVSEPVVSYVSHEARVLCVFTLTDDARVLAPVQLVVLHVSDDGLQGLAWLRLVLEPKVDDKVTIFPEYFSTEVAVEPCTERELSKFAPSWFILFLVVLVFQNS